MKKNSKKITGILLAVVLTIAGYPSLALAQSSSPNYRVEESYFGIGGNPGASSTNYGARQSGGSLGAGSAASDDYRAEVGFNTPSEPFLEMYVTGADVDLGDLDDTTPSIASAQAEDCDCSFSVRSYLSSEYVVITASAPPTNESGDELQAKSSQGNPSGSTSVEEFGINLVDNSSPDVGANPANQPDDSFADGEAASGYEIADQFKYVIGDIVARSPAVASNPGIGKTDYTITYMAKISNITPAGFYEMRHDLIAVPTF
jgi:hypothetical protein